MNPTTEVPAFLGGEAPSKEQAREAAQKAFDNAVAALAQVKASIEDAQKVKAEAQKVIDAAKPSILRAEARLDLAKADLMEFGPIKSEGGDKVDFDTVLAVLKASPKQMTVAEIVEALKTQGINANADNLKAYCARWSQTGAILKGEKNNRLEPARFYAPPTNGTPAFLAPAAPKSTPLPEDFPAREWLEKAGITTKEDLVGATVDSLTEYNGIGKATAKAILAALEA